MTRLKVALMGLTGVGAEYLRALRSDDRFDLVAVADTDSDVVRRHAETTPPSVYEDYRSLIVETTRSGLDLLFVALEPFQSVEFVEMAATRSVGVFHKAPFARDTREARRLVERFAQHDRPLVVSRWWQFDAAFAPVLTTATSGDRVHAASAEVRTADVPVGWRGDSTRAGGGVLLNGAYEVVDFLVHLLGLPESVIARCGSMLAPGAPRNYDTEDVVVLSLDFGRGRIASVTAWRGVTQPAWRVVLMSSSGVIEACPDTVVVIPRDGSAPECRAVGKADSVGAAIGAFGTSCIERAARFASTGQEHLTAMAVIEAAYLSARTGAPESPGRFVE